MSCESICNCLADHISRLLGALEQQNTQTVCDNDGCYEENPFIQTPQVPTNTQNPSPFSNLTMMLMGLMLIYFMLTVLGRQSRTRLNEKVRNNPVERERDAAL